eukprot:TRINITY_DN9279_c0_g1_i1.p1 TRINITY_DN9279_c0_g1~~TRINITY_DN9279_c0_g1_i1.p1  ORF type:complete len:120 (+),score=9.27 TRINITY_DN9279_c0_g1_i1:153-512(+)
MASKNSYLQQVLAQKRKLEEDLKNVEKQIYDLEENYIEDTHHYGNIIRGWEGYINYKHKHASIRRPKIAEKDRIFSSSSKTAPECKRDDDEGEDSEEDEPRSRRHKNNHSDKEDDLDDS